MNERNAVVEKFYVENRDTLIKRVSFRAGGEYNAEDVVSEAFARALKYWNSFDPKRHELGAWFSSILNNALKDFKREELQYGMCVDIDEEECGGFHPSTIDRDVMSVIYEMIEEKEGHTKDILILHFKYQYKVAEIVDVVNIPRETVKKTLVRFKSDVRNKFKEG